MDYNKPRAYRQGRIEAAKRRETNKKKKAQASYMGCTTQQAMLFVKRHNQMETVSL